MMSVYVCSIIRLALNAHAQIFFHLWRLHIEFPDHSANELRQLTFRLCKCFSVVSVVVVVVVVHLVSRF